MRGIYSMMPYSQDWAHMGYKIVYFATAKPAFIPNQIIKEQRKEGFKEWQCQGVHVETSIGGQYAISATFPKVKWVDITKKWPGRRAMIVRLKNVDNEKHKKIAVWAATLCNLPYGWASLLYFKAEKLFGGHNILASISRPFCSYLCAWADEREVPDYWASEPEKIMPAHYLDEEKVDFIWEGIIPNHL